jgi:hypothetical protein
MAEMKPKPGKARPKPLPPLEINKYVPVTSGRLLAEDIANLLDFAEVMPRTGTDPNKEPKLDARKF